MKNYFYIEIFSILQREVFYCGPHLVESWNLTISECENELKFALSILNEHHFVKIYTENLYGIVLFGHFLRCTNALDLVVLERTDASKRKAREHIPI
jgi:hypothetical protein